MLYELIFAIDFLFEHIYDEVFGGEHILQIACQSIETVMRVFLRLFLVYRHATFIASVSALAISCLVIHDGDAFDLLVAVDARDHDVGASSLVQVNVFPECLGAALVKGLALNGLVVAELIMRLHLGVAELHLTSKVAILALELHLQ